METVAETRNRPRGHTQARASQTCLQSCHVFREYLSPQALGGSSLPLLGLGQLQPAFFEGVRGSPTGLAEHPVSVTYSATGLF